MEKYVAPDWNLQAFNCPHCGAFAHQIHRTSTPDLNGAVPNKFMNTVGTTICAQCTQYAIWNIETMVYPQKGIGPLPNPDLPETVRNLYLEASAVGAISSRAAAALLRLALQLLCKELGGDGKNINDDIKRLVEKGLPSPVQKAMDSLRIIGNDAVHPGQIDTDNQEVVTKLFKLINVVADYMITQPKHIDEIYDSLPEEKKKQILQRDQA